MQTKTQKEKIVNDLSQEIKDSKAVIFSDFKGLNVKDMTTLRNELRKEDVSFQVLKKTLLGIALKNAKMDVDAKKMEGQVAVAVSKKDEVIAAKIIAQMAKKNEKIRIIGGILGKDVLSEKEVIALSKLPSKEELLSKLVGTLNAPVSGFVNVLAGSIRNLVQVLKAVSENK
jgi:large subunit ribosomal protein L10